MLLIKIFLTIVGIHTIAVTLVVAPAVKDANMGLTYICEILAMCILAVGGLWTYAP